MSWSGKRQHRAFTGELWKSKAKEITSGKPREIQITKTSQSELEEAEETPVTGARSRKTCNRYQAWDFKHITGAKRGNSMQSKLRFVCLCCILLLIVFQTPRSRFSKTGLHCQISIRFCGLSIRIPVNSFYPCLVYLRRKPRQHSIVVLGCTHLFSSHHFLQVVSVIVCEVSLSLAFLVMCLRLQWIKVTLSGAISNLRARWKS